MTELYSRYVNTPIGRILVAATPAGVCRVCFPGEPPEHWYLWFNRHFSTLPLEQRYPLVDQAALEIEAALLRQLQERHPTWVPAPWWEVADELGLPATWRHARPDGVWRDGAMLVVAECYARIGALKSGHRRKLALDALKLMALRPHVASAGREMRGLIVVPAELAAHLEGDGWLPEALRLAAEITPVELTAEERQRLEVAVARQGQGQARTRRG